MDLLHRSMKRRVQFTFKGEVKTQLDRLNAIGGLKSVVPSEGITFVFKGKLYKYTGAFAPANQILGMLKFV